MAAERAPASVLVGAVGVACPADAIWTRHNRPQRRAVPGPPRRRASTADADAAGDGVSLGKSKGDGQKPGKKSRVHIDVISCQIQDRYTGKIKKQRIGWRLREIGKP